MARKKVENRKQGGKESQNGVEQKISKTAAVREALAEGLESNGDIVDFLKTRYGLEMTKSQVSVCKSQAKTKAVTLATAQEPEREKPERRSSIDNGKVDMVDDLALMKKLVEKLGGEQVHKIVGLFE